MRASFRGGFVLYRSRAYHQGPATAPVTSGGQACTFLADRTGRVGVPQRGRLPGLAGRGSR